MVLSIFTFSICWRCGGNVLNRKTASVILSFFLTRWEQEASRIVNVPRLRSGGLAILNALRLLGLYVKIQNKSFLLANPPCLRL